MSLDYWGALKEGSIRRLGAIALACILAGALLIFGACWWLGQALGL